LPTDTERRLEALENLLLFGGGVVAGTASGRQLAAAAAKAAARRAPGVAARAGGTALGVARRHPYATAAFVAYVAHKEGVSLETARELVESQVSEVEEATRYTSPLLTPPLRAIVDPRGTIPRYKRKVSKANKAVKYGMSLLKAGTKAATGADKGKLPKGAFKIATVAAGLANKNTASKIGKGSSKVKTLARKIRKWW
jgi:hypothetical protein